jgi:hypothetical protein
MFREARRRKLLGTAAVAHADFSVRTTELEQRCGLALK